MDSIKVAIKVRPLIKREREENLPVQWTVQDNSITPLDPELKKRGEPFYFDHIFDAAQSNVDVFDVVAKPIVDAALNGINGTIFAYGQTSSGKTFTMMGGDDNPGVIPLSIDYIFDKITCTYDREFLLRVSYIEIYNEKINDLLDKNGIDLKIKEEKSGQAIVLCKEEVANCPEVVLAIMRKGIKNRRIGETNMNERSSRSHTIFRITIESREPNSDGAVQVSQLNLVDLAGSERPKQSGATGDRFNEGRHINMSLSALGLVIMQLSESQDNPHRFVNFRDSKLTRILQTSLGGNAMTTIICAVTPAALDETQCTLAFASRAKRIKNKPTVNECVSDGALLKRYAKQLAKLKNELEKARGANLEEMESKLMEKESKLIEKDRAYQLLEERIELLKTRIVSGNTAIEDGRSRRRTQRRRTWGGPGTFQTKLLPFQTTGVLPTIKEMEKTPEKISKKEHIKSRQSIIQTLDIPSETFQTAFTDFEIELIECERSRSRPSDGSSGGDDDFFVSTRPRRVVSFKDDIAESENGSDRTPEKRIEPTSPETPRAVLRSRMNFLMEQYNELTEDHRSLVEFTQLEKQMFVEEAVEAAMIEHKKIVENLEKALAESEKSRQGLFDKYTELHIHATETDKISKDLKRELSETRESLTRLKNEKEILVNELNKMKTSSTAVQAQASYDDNRDKECSSIFANNTYFDEINVSDSQCDSILTNEIESMESLQIYDTSMTIDTSNNKLDDSKRSKDSSNATYGEFLKQIEEKSSEELTRVMQDLLNVKISLEEENAKLGSNLRRKIREADDVKNDIRELKMGIEKLQETIQILTNENTSLTSKLTNEKEAAKEAEKSFQATIAELNSSINVMAQEKIAMEQSIREIDDTSKPPLANDEKTMNLINDYKKAIDSLTSENIELSTNLMNKIEELDNLKVLKEKSGDHECHYRELLMKLKEDYKHLETENIELSNNLMDKIEEYDRLKHQVSRCKLSSSPKNERNNLVNISLNQTNLIDNEKSSNDDKIDAKSKKEKESTDVKCSDSTVDDLLSLSRLSLPAERSTIENNEKTNGQTVDDLLRMSIIPGESKERRKNLSNESTDEWKLKAEMLGEQVENLTLLNEKLTNLKTTSCKQCAHLTELRNNRKMLQNEVKSLNRTLEELQTKFEREFADTKILRTKASEDLNLSVCDATFNNSSNFEAFTNVSYVEERVQLLHDEIESLKDKHEKLTNLYREKCEEIEKLQDNSFRESTPPSTTVDSPRLRRDDSKLERIKTDMEKLQNDLRHFKKSIAGISSSLQKFVNEKTTMQNEIDELRTEKREFEDKLKERENCTSNEEKCASLRNEITNLCTKISNFEIVEKQLRDKISSMEAEGKTLIFEKNDLAEKIMTERKYSSEAREKILSLENEISRLASEIANYATVTEGLESEKSSLETQVQRLNDEKEILQGKIIAIEASFVPREKFESLTNDVARMRSEMKNYEINKEVLENENSSMMRKMQSIDNEREEEKMTMTNSIEEKDAIIATLRQEIARLNTEIDNSNVVKNQLEDAKSSLENEIEGLKRDNKNNEIKITKIQSLENEVSQLCSEIENSYESKTELEEAKITLESKLVALKNENEIYQEKLSNADASSATMEKIAFFENEVSRLVSEMENAKTIQSHLEEAKSSMKMENDLLNTEKTTRDEIINELQRSLENLEQENSSLRVTIEELNSEKNKCHADLRSRDENVNDFESKLQELTMNLENCTKINAELNERLKHLETRENELIVVKEDLERKIENLLSEKTCVDENLKMENDLLNTEKTARDEIINELQRSLENVEQENSSLRVTIEELNSEKNKCHADLRSRDENLNDFESKLQELTMNLENCTKINAELNERLKHLETRENELIVVKEDLERKIENLLSEKTCVDENLKMENDLLNTEKTARDEIINELQRSLENVEQENSSLRVTIEELNSEKNKCHADLRSRDENVNDFESKLQELTMNLENCTKINAELSERLKHLETRENELIVVKEDLERKIENLLSEKSRVDENSTRLSEGLEKLLNENSSLATISETLKSKLQDALENLSVRTKENAELRTKLEEYESLSEETTKEKSLLTNEITILRDETKTLGDSLSSLKSTMKNLEQDNCSLKLQVGNSTISNESKYIIELKETYERIDNYERIIDELKEKLRAYSDKTILNSRENDDSPHSTSMENEKSSISYERINDELESAKKSMKKEIMSLKSSTDDMKLDEKTAMELFGYFVTTIMSKEREVIKALSDNFEIEKRRIEEKKRQSLDAEKRATIWAKELEAEIERNQQDMTRMEAKNTELSQKIDKLENLLMECNHENEMLKEKMTLLEADFDTSGIIVEKSSEALQSSILNSTRNPTAEKERFIQESVDTREMELSARLRLLEKQYKEKFDELTINLEHQKTRNIDLSNNLDGLEANEKQLKSIIDVKTNELSKCNMTIERLQREYDSMTQSYVQSNSENMMKSAKIDEITSLLKSKCDLLSEYKTKLETITPEYEKLKEQSSERQLRLENYKSEIERVKSESEKDISLLKDRLDSKEIELSGYEKQVAEMTSLLKSKCDSLSEYKTKLETITPEYEKLKEQSSERQLRLENYKSEIERVKSESDKNISLLKDRLDSKEIESSGYKKQLAEMTSLLKSKCDSLSEYKTKLETITPEYEKLKEQSSERQLRLENYKSEIERMKSESDKDISLLKDRLDSKEIESTGYKKQLAELTNRNTVLQMELVDLGAKCRELEISNGKLTSSMRNSTSKIRAEEEMEELRDRNRTLERNLDGAGNRISDLQETKNRLTKELMDLRIKHEAIVTENDELKSVMSSHRSSVADVIESREKYDALLLEKNRLEMELEDRRTRFSQMEKRIESLERENQDLKLKNNELDAEMDDIVGRIRDLTKENSELDDKLYAAQTTIDSYEEKMKKLTSNNENLERKIDIHVAEIRELKTQGKKLRNDNAAHAKTSSTLSSEISELRGKMSQQERGESLSCGDSERSSSPVVESVRIDSRRRRSRNELFNLNRPLEIFENNAETSECRCGVLEERYSALEKDLALKNAKIATLELKIQSEVFPHMRKCKDLEEIVASLTKKNKLLKAEMRKLEETRAQEMSSECHRCRQWKINKRDQASQCMPDSTPIYMSGMSSGIIDGHIKVAKLEKDKATLKTLCRNRQKIIFELEHRVKELEALTDTKSAVNDEKFASPDSAASSASSKAETVSTSRQAMKENVPANWENQRRPFQLRRDWFN